MLYLGVGLWIGSWVVGIGKIVLVFLLGVFFEFCYVGCVILIFGFFLWLIKCESVV